MGTREVDVVVVGAGPAGEVVAGELADGGLEVVVVERELVGGECAFWACMPSKALLRPAQALAEARRVPGAAEAVTGALDVDAALARRDEVVHDLDDAEQVPWLERKGIGLVRGAARLTGARGEVVVGDELLRARRAVVLAPGSDAAMPPIPGLREARPWTNREATVARTAPGSLVVLGGGVVGTELAQAWASLGSRVTLVEAGERLLAREEPFAAEQVADALRAAGVDVRLGAKAERVEREDGEVRLHLEGGDVVAGDELLCALGRTPRTGGLGLEAFGIEGGKPVEVDDDLRVAGTDWLHAVGDVNGRVLLTHMGKHQARVLADVLLGRPAPRRLGPRGDGPGSPRVIFTEPQVAAVGLTLAAAQDAGLPVRAVDVGTNANAGGSFVGRGVDGTARLVVDTEREVVVGATFTGAEVGEALHAATIAVVAEVPIATLWACVPAFPTRSELWLRLLEACRS